MDTKTVQMEHLRTRRRGLSGRAAPLVLVLLLGVMGCDDFLPTEPKGELTTENFFETAGQAVQATSATYAMLRNWSVHVFAWIGLTDIVSDDATKGSVPADADFLLRVDNLELDPANVAFSTVWEGYYQGIYRANVAIQNIPGIEMDAGLRARLVAENQFLRAYYYFFLARAFGGVPLITQPLRPDEYFQQRATREDVFAQVERDLADAIAALPDSYGAADVGRATKGAAQALLARVHLFQGEYAEALAQAQAVIDSGLYDLLASYGQIFTPLGENSLESVFEAQTVALDGGNPGPSGAGSQYAVVQGVRGTPNLGWGFNTPSPNLEASFEPGDPRHQATIMYPWEVLPDGTDVVYLNASMPNNRYNQKVFQSAGNPGGTGNGGVNIRRIRYADVLLMGAEAAYRMGDEAQARTWLNEVRARARGGASVTLGFQPEQLSEVIATDVLGLTGASRVFVRYLNPATAAYAAGLRGFASTRDDDVTPLPVRVESMDLVTAVDATLITDLASFHAAVAGYPAGATVALSVQRVTHPAGGSPSTGAVVATVPVLALLPDVTSTGQALLDAIWAERRHELAMEQHRWFDIVRQDRAAQVLTALTCEDRALPAGCSSIVFPGPLYPIPAGEVAIAGLDQNP